MADRKELKKTALDWLIAQVLQKGHYRRRSDLKSPDPLQEAGVNRRAAVQGNAAVS